MMLNKDKILNKIDELKNNPELKQIIFKKCTSLSVLEEIKICNRDKFQEYDVYVYDFLLGLDIKSFKNLSSVKKFVKHVIEDNQQRHYNELLFKVEEIS